VRLAAALDYTRPFTERRNLKLTPSHSTLSADHPHPYLRFLQKFPTLAQNACANKP